MIDIPMKYEISFFADMSEIRPSPAIITELINDLQDKGFLPRMFQELPNQEPRISLVTPGNQWEIMIRRERMVIVKRPIARDPASWGSVADFGTEVAGILGRVLGHLPPRKASRVALVTEELMQAMTDEALSQVYTKLFNPIQFYAENPPSEWLVRWVGRQAVEINNVTESLNVLSIFSRVQGQFLDQEGILKFDRVQLGFDINTFQGNTDTRFTADSISDFLDKAMEIKASLVSQLGEHLT